MLSSFAEILGLLLVAVGFGFAWLPLGLIAAGAALLWLARSVAVAGEVK